MQVTRKNGAISVKGNPTEWNESEIKKWSFKKFLEVYSGKIKTPLKETYEAITGRKADGSDKKPVVKETKQPKSKKKK